MMSSPQTQPQQDVILPESVEQSIKRVCIDKNQPPLKIYARKMLFEIGEKGSVEILNTIVSTNTPIKSFSGFVSSLIKANYPEQAATVLNSLYNSPHSPSPASPHNPSKHALLNFEITVITSMYCLFP